MRIILIFLGCLSMLSIPASAGLGSYLGRVALGRQVDRLLLVEVDTVSRASLSLMTFAYGKTLSPYEQAQALAHEHSLVVALINYDTVETNSLLTKLIKLSDNSLSITAGKDKIIISNKKSSRKNAAAELLNYSRKQLADIDTLKLDYDESDQLEFIRLKRFLDDNDI